MATRSKLTFLKLGHSSKVRDTNQIVVVGAEDVGKTGAIETAYLPSEDRKQTANDALVVRFLTRKYLPEYTHGIIARYERTIHLDDKEVAIRIIDIPGTINSTALLKQDVLQHADGFLVVYSSTDQKSFEIAQDILKRFHQEFSHMESTPIVLVANKDDLTHFRRVSTVEGQRVALVYPGCSFYEISAARDPDNVDSLFRELIREIIQSKDSKKHLNVNSTLTVKSPNLRRNSAGNSTLSSWWRRPRSSSACENRQDRTFTM